MNCPQCNATNKRGVKFCKSCGFAFSTNTPQKKKCPNGHIMDSTWKECPYCKEAEKSDELPLTRKGRTTVIENKPSSPRRPKNRNRKTEPEIRFSPTTGKKHNQPQKYRKPSKKTVIINTQGQPVSPALKKGRLVGFLVTYTHDPAGFFYEIRQGRHIIGSSGEADITIKDDMISSQHAILLYRKGNFFFKDNLSTNGSFVNGKNINVNDTLQLKNYDVIKMGKTKLRLIKIFPDRRAN